jgi:uncharacterized protein
MKPKNFNFNAIDVMLFAKEAAQLQGVLPIENLPRLMASQAGDSVLATCDVIWFVTGDVRKPKGAELQYWLHVRAQTQATLTCQRCLASFDKTLLVERSFMFVRDEIHAAELDAAIEDDVLVLTKDLNLQTLIEDELLLALPLVPRHEVCPQLIEVPSQDRPEAQMPHPFAALAALKRGGLLN